MKTIRNLIWAAGLTLALAACNKDLCPANNGSYMELKMPDKPTQPINTAMISSHETVKAIN